MKWGEIRKDCGENCGAQETIEAGFVAWPRFAGHSVNSLINFGP